MPNYDINSLLKMSREMFKSGQHTEAIELLTPALEQTPDPRLFYRRSKHYDLIDQPLKAVADLTSAIDIGPAKSYYFSDRASLLASTLGRDADAIPDYEMALQCDPKDVLSHQMVCLSYLKIGELTKAREHAVASVRLSSNEGLSHFCMGEVLFSEKLFKEACPHFAKATKLDPSADQYWAALGMSQAQTGLGSDIELGCANFSKAIELDNTSASYFISRGRLLNKLGKRDDAIADLRHALTLNPDEREQGLIDNSLAAMELEG